jgi:hypothetical protein
MTGRWVIPSLLNLQAAIVNWHDEAGRLEIQDPMLDTGFDPAPVQLRWLLSPAVGLPLQPFTIWRTPHPGGNPTTQELANLPDWEPIEIVGLPVDDSWGDTGYWLDEQGPVSQGLPSIDAALRRLQMGAPRYGWAPLGQGIANLPPWESPDLDHYLWSLVEGRLMRGLRAMLIERPDPLTHASYVDREHEPAHLAHWKPRLLGTQPGAVPALNEPANAEWHPLGLLAVGAGTDPLASLALGFGTAVFGQRLAAKPTDVAGFDIFMVSVRHQLDLFGQTQEFELADVVLPHGHPQAPDAPGGLSAGLLSRTPPQATDGPAIESVAVGWNRPPNPVYAAQPADRAHPASYAVARFGPESWRGAILLTPRPDGMGGWLPYAAGRPDSNENRPALFADHLVRATTIGAQVVADPVGRNHTYAVAAQDLFGRWSPWQTVPYDNAHEAPQAPSILAVQLDLAGNLSVDFSWDWSDRSPEFMEVSGAFEDDAGNRLLSAVLQFGGQPQPATGGFQVLPLAGNRQQAADWGAAQDRDPAEPGVRFYRMHAVVPVNFGGRRKRVFQVQARGQCHVHHFMVPGWNKSPFGKPRKIEIFDPAPPPPPQVPEAPQWASLPDVEGVSRAVLHWEPVPGAKGYVLYEATETTLLAVLGRPGPDTAQPFPDRLAVLRAADLPATRSSFRRLQKELIQSTAHEVALPRGSGVLHLYAVTAMSENQVESAWPTTSKGFIAVAAPRLVVPAAPSLEATAETAGQPAARLNIRLRPGPAARQVELYRTRSEELARSADTMGPPLDLLNVNGDELTFSDTTVTSGWQRVWYRAVAWSADDNLAGLVGARSAPSPAASLLLPPQAAPDLSDLRVNEPGSSPTEALISWVSGAPVAVTPLGPHTAVLEARDLAGEVLARLDGRLDGLPFVNTLADLPPANLADRKIFRVGTPQRTYAWVPRPTGPAADQPFTVTVKLIDPLGRIAHLSADVPPWPTLPLPELGHVRFARMVGPLFGPPPRLAVHWQLLAPAPPDPPEQYVLRAELRMPDDPLQPVTIETRLDQAPEVADVRHPPPAQVMALFHRIARLQGTQHYFIFLRIAHPLEVRVTLVDPLGRSVTQTGTLP